MNETLTKEVPEDVYGPTTSQDNSLSIPTSQKQDLMAILQGVLLAGADNVDAVGKILDYQERILNREAECAFYTDLAIVQGAIPKIIKDGEAVVQKAGNGQREVKRKYETLEAILDGIEPVVYPYGFSITVDTDVSPLPGHMRIMTRLGHKLGHSKVYNYDCPVDAAGRMTSIQGRGSSLSYGRRYSLKMIFNLNTGDDDDGGADVMPKRAKMPPSNVGFMDSGNLPPPLITPDEIRILNDLMIQAEVSLDTVCINYNIDRLSAMDYDTYERACRKLRKTIDDRKK